MSYTHRYIVSANFSARGSNSYNKHTDENHKQFAIDLFNNVYGDKALLEIHMKFQALVFNFKKHMFFDVVFDDNDNVTEIKTQNCYEGATGFKPEDFSQAKEKKEDHSNPQLSALSRHRTVRWGLSRQERNPDLDNTYGLSFPDENDENSTYSL